MGTAAHSTSVLPSASEHADLRVFSFGSFALLGAQCGRAEVRETADLDAVLPGKRLRSPTDEDHRQGKIQEGLGGYRGGSDFGRQGEVLARSF